MQTAIITLISIVVLFTITIILNQAKQTWEVGEIIRTPDTAFDDLEDYPFKPNYIESLGYRVHYLDEGPRDGEVVLLLHGQPSWSYLYRHMIPLLASAGYRVIAPDNVGFGKSDKPKSPDDHNYQMHVDVTSKLIEQLDLKNINLFAQDWGGLIGLRVVPEQHERFSRIMLSNTALPAMGGLKGWLGYPLFKFGVWREGTVETLTAENGEFSFTKWVAYAKTTSNFDFESLFQTATSRELSDRELAGYSAPYPNNEYIAGVRKFPSMVASQLRQNQKVMHSFYEQWDKPLITMFGSDDKLMEGREKVWQETVPGAKGQKHKIIKGGAHFIQEDKPKELVERLIEFINDNPL